MLEALPQIFELYQKFVVQYWDLIMTSSVLSGFMALAVLDRVFGIFDIIRR